MPWQDALQLPRAVRNIRHEMTGDWYRDPWNFPEFEFLRDERPDLLLDFVSTRPGRLSLIDVPKENFGVRPAVILGPLDRLGYQALVDVISGRAIGHLQGWVYGWRLSRRASEAGDYARQSTEWERLQAHHVELSKVAKFGLKTDLTSFFASIPLSDVCERLQSEAPGKISATVTEWLTAWSSTPRRSGLPQRSGPSAVLANMYIQPIDGVISAYVTDIRGGGPDAPALASRWMDDIWLLGDEEAPLRRVQLELSEAARNLGLELNSGKTAVLTGSELIEELGRLSMSGVDYALHSRESDWLPFGDVLGHVTAKPERADRSIVRFLTTRLRDKRLPIAERRRKLRELLEVAEHLPHAADHLSRASRDLGFSPDRRDWFVQYCQSDWGIFSWSQAQWLTGFSTRLKPTQAMVALLMEWIGPGMPVDRMAVAVHRLSAWAPDDLRDTVSSLADGANHPFERRVLGLAAVTLGLSRRLVTSYLDAYEELGATMEMVRHRDYAPIPPAKDFDWIQQ